MTLVLIISGSCVLAQQNDKLLENLQKRVQELESVVTKQQKEIQSLHRSRKLSKDLEQETEDLIQGKVEKEEPKSFLEAALGLEVNVTLSWIVMGTCGVKKYLSREGDRTDGATTIDLSLACHPIENGTAYLLLEAGTGDGPDKYIGTFYGGIIDESGEAAQVSVSEAWYQHEFFEGKLSIRFGKIDFTTDFDSNAAANDGTSQFVSSLLVYNPAIAYPDDFSLGMFVWCEPASWIKLGWGIADADADWEQVFDNIFSMWEVQFNVAALFDLSEEMQKKWEGTYRFYFWLNDSDNPDLRDPVNDTKMGYGFGLSFDQKIDDMFILFLRYGHQRERVYAYGDALAAGVEIPGKFWSRPQDVFGIGWVRLFTGRVHRHRVQDPMGISSADETLLELYYRFTINEYMNISPIFQLWHNANGEDDSDTFVTFAVRGSISF